MTEPASAPWVDPLDTDTGLPVAASSPEPKLSRTTVELARQAIGSLPAGHPQRQLIAIALDELDAALDERPRPA